MSWFSRKAPRPEPTQPPGEEEELGPRPLVHPSLALQELCEQLEEGGSYRFLDLGPALGANVEFFSRFTGHIQIVDLHTSLTSDQTLAVRVREHPEAVLRKLLPSPEGGTFDVVLAWDLFNYLEREQLRALGEQLAALTRHGGYLLALLSALREIPARPQAFRIVDQGTLAYQPRSRGNRTSSHYQPADVATLMPGFSVYRSFLLRHGVREYLLVRSRAAAS